MVASFQVPDWANIHFPDSHLAWNAMVMVRHDAKFRAPCEATRASNGWFELKKEDWRHKSLIFELLKACKDLM